MNELGRLAYNAYRESRHGLTFTGHRMQEWEKLSNGLRHSWQVAAETVATYAITEANGTILFAET